MSWSVINYPFSNICYQYFYHLLPFSTTIEFFFTIGLNLKPKNLITSLLFFLQTFITEPDPEVRIHLYLRTEPRARERKTSRKKNTYGALCLFFKRIIVLTNNQLPIHNTTRLSSVLYPIILIYYIIIHVLFLLVETCVWN